MNTQTLSLLSFVALTAGVLAAPAPERISLWQGRAPAGEGGMVDGDAFITVHRPAEPSGTAVVICPGGAYEVLCVEPEGHGIARWLNAHGITGVVLEYRLPKGNRFVPLLDAQRALRMTRARAEAWGCDPRRVGILGFSAGGHLASTAATRFDAGRPEDPDPLNRPSCRPDFAILIYPVITMGAHTHGGSKANLLGPNPEPAMVEQYSNEKQVTAQTPPAFLAHAKDDTAVPPVNSRMFFEALQAHGVTGRYLELPDGGHSLNWYKGSSWDAWQRESLVWLEEIGMKPASRPAGGE
jgi:acetyl esterase/lipase